jgi:hypothetical protein
MGRMSRMERWTTSVWGAAARWRPGAVSKPDTEEIVPESTTQDQLSGERKTAGDGVDHIALAWAKAEGAAARVRATRISKSEGSGSEEPEEPELRGLGEEQHGDQTAQGMIDAVLQVSRRFFSQPSAPLSEVPVPRWSQRLPPSKRDVDGDW